MAQSAWTELGAAEPQPVRADAHPAPSTHVMRFRRHQRPVLGPLDAAAATLQRNAREVLLGPALLLVPVAALNLIVSNLVYDDFASFDDAAVSLPEFVGGVESASGVETLLAYIGVLTGSLAVALVGGYTTVLVLRQANGLAVTIGACLRGLARRLPALLLAWVVGHAWIVLGAVGLVQLSGADMAPFLLLVVPLALFLVTFTALVSPVIVAERAGFVRGLRRSIRLVRLRFGAVFGFVLLSILLGGGLRAMITWTPQLLEDAGMITFAGSTWLAEGVAGQLAPLVVAPWIALATSKLYLQVRMDAEGMDLMVEGDRAFE